MGLQVGSHCQACEAKHREKLVEHAKGRSKLNWAAWGWFIAWALSECVHLTHHGRWTWWH